MMSVLRASGVVAFLFAFVGLSLAPVPAVAQVSESPSPAHVAKARVMLQDMMIDAGTVHEGALLSFQLLMPSFRDRMAQAPFYASATPAHQQAFQRTMEGLPPILADEAMTSAPGILDEFAPRLAALMTDQELADVSSFIRTPDGRAAYLRSVRGEIYVAAHATNPDTSAATDGETHASAAFMQTAGGHAIVRQDVQQLLSQLGERVTSAPNMAARIRRELCASLENDCPPQLQAQ